jgi:hypothetical protein
MEIIAAGADQRSQADITSNGRRHQMAAGSNMAR